MRYHDREPRIKYIHYLIKNGKYSAEFEATDDVQAKLITRRIHGKECNNVALFRIAGTTRNGDKKLKGIQL